MTSPRPERYAIEDDRYVLYIGPTRALSTDTVALLVDTRLHMLITHGDPVSVRRELDEMREVLRNSRAPQYEKDWLLLEGRPDVHWLNQLLQDPTGAVNIDTAFDSKRMQLARDIARNLLDRVSKPAG